MSLLYFSVPRRQSSQIEMNGLKLKVVKIRQAPHALKEQVRSKWSQGKHVLRTSQWSPLYPDDSMMSFICHSVNSHTVKKRKTKKPRISLSTYNINNCSQMVFFVIYALYFLSLFKQESDQSSYGCEWSQDQLRSPTFWVLTNTRWLKLQTCIC